jgi:5-methylcytosine-specific restriction endonuclease McrA
MARPRSYNSGIDLTNKTLEEVEDIFKEFSNNKMQWVIKFNSVDIYKTEYDRIRATIRRLKHQDTKGETFNDYAYRVRDGMRERNREKIAELTGLRCVDCGFVGHHSQMDFHHLDPTKKDKNIGHLIWQRTWEKIKEEIDKCILLCSNCHRLRHWKIDNE